MLFAYANAMCCALTDGVRSNRVVDGDWEGAVAGRPAKRAVAKTAAKRGGCDMRIGCIQRSGKRTGEAARTRDTTGVTPHAPAGILRDDDQ
jgi:hypothetical protein